MSFQVSMETGSICEFCWMFCEVVCVTHIYSGNFASQKFRITKHMDLAYLIQDQVINSLGHVFLSVFFECGEEYHQKGVQKCWVTI